MLVGMLEENIEMLESFSEKVEEWERKNDERKEKYGDEYWRHYTPYPSQGTSKSHINDIVKLTRKELLKI